MTWINADERTSHSVWFKGRGWEESVRMFPEETVSFTFEEPGTFRFICGPHDPRPGARLTR